MKNNKTKSGFNMYEFTNRHRKKIVRIVSGVIVASMILGMFAQFLV